LNLTRPEAIWSTKLGAYNHYQFRDNGISGSI
jgi:hypothetical protein